MRKRHWLLMSSIPVGIAFGIAGCASLVSQRTTPLAPSDGTAAPPIVIAVDTEVMPAGGLSNTLKAGSVWTYVGRISEGPVYRIKDDVFTIEATNRHEAYLVVLDGKLVGFYLPVEHGFVASTSTTTLLATPLPR